MLEKKEKVDVGAAIAVIAFIALLGLANGIVEPVAQTIEQVTAFFQPQPEPINDYS